MNNKIISINIEYFFGKFFIFSAAVKQGFFWMVVWAAINSIISVYYYLRPIVMMYMHEGEAKVENDCMASAMVAVVIMAVLVFVTGFATEPVYQFVVQAVNGLF